MRILNVSYSDLFGGAAKSSYRIHRSLNSIGGNFTSEMLVVKKLSQDHNVITLNKPIVKLLFKIKNYIGMIFSKIDNNKAPLHRYN